MENLKELLCEEKSRLEKILQKTKEQLLDAPQGTLRLSSSKKWTQYYHCLSGQNKNGVYIPKTNEELIHRLAQKSYDEKVQKLAEKRLWQIQRILKDYENEEIENIYLYEHSERHKLIEPVEQTWEQQLKEWMSEKYKGKGFQEGTPVIMTERGERVRSKSEKILADYFYRNDIYYKYERPLYLDHFGVVHPDFTFLSKKTRKEIYWEHDGRMDDPLYAQNAVRKIQAYEENDIYPGERLILTFETEQNVLSTRLIQKLVNKYL